MSKDDDLSKKIGLVINLPGCESISMGEFLKTQKGQFIRKIEETQKLLNSNPKNEYISPYAKYVVNKYGKQDRLFKKEELKEEAKNSIIYKRTNEKEPAFEEKYVNIILSRIDDALFFPSKTLNAELIVWTKKFDSPASIVKELWTGLIMAPTYALLGIARFSVGGFQTLWYSGLSLFSRDHYRNRLNQVKHRFNNSFYDFAHAALAAVRPVRLLSRAVVSAKSWLWDKGFNKGSFFSKTNDSWYSYLSNNGFTEEVKKWCDNNLSPKTAWENIVEDVKKYGRRQTTNHGFFSDLFGWVKSAIYGIIGFTEMLVGAVGMLGSIVLFPILPSYALIDSVKYSGMLFAKGAVHVGHGVVKLGDPLKAFVRLGQRLYNGPASVYEQQTDTFNFNPEMKTEFLSPIYAQTYKRVFDVVNNFQENGDAKLFAEKVYEAFYNKESGLSVRRIVDSFGLSMIDNGLFVTLFGSGRSNFNLIKQCFKDSKLPTIEEFNKLGDDDKKKVAATIIAVLSADTGKGLVEVLSGDQESRKKDDSEQVELVKTDVTKGNQQHALFNIPNKKAKEFVKSVLDEKDSGVIFAVN
jgi:hypothetical protein